nr:MULTISPECIES: hypothetical protein [Microbacterium]
MRRAADWVCEAVAGSPTPAPVVLIDGRSGSGKSSLARTIAQDWPGPGTVQVLALDSLYPGWDGLASAGVMLRDDVLAPRSAGEPGRWRRWDWVHDVPAEEHRVDPGAALIVEGAGALTAGTAAHADIRVWLESPAASRRERALSRDGDGYRPHWDRWAVQERTHILENTPARRATHVFVVP